MGHHTLKIFSCRNSEPLAEKIVEARIRLGDETGVKLGDSACIDFNDGEYQPAYNETIRGCTVFIVQSTFPPADNLMELLLMIDAARRASAHKVVAVIPYFGWARQDRKDRPRVSIGAKLVANLLTAAGVDRIMTMDLHADQIQGFFDIPVDHLYASKIFVPYLKSLAIENLSIAAPDVGGAKRASAYSKHLDIPMIISHKQREKPGEVASITPIGDVEGRNVVIIDDLIDTAGTLTLAARMLMDKGAASVRAMATHPVLSGPAYDRINASPLTEVITTDTIPLKRGEDISKFTVLSVADILAETIDRVYSYREISSQFIF
jgi:ribose-phosphate pyrophosphokinase